VDICIVGAGVAGLNAASVARRLLPPGGTVAVVDRRDGPGGMWNDAYSYVRLHQPHGLFTAGDIRWRLRRDRGYLAARDEVLAHLCYCLEVIGERITLDPRWGWNYLSHREEAGRVRIAVHAPDGDCREIVARRLVKAFGYGIEENRPLEVSSSQVRSISPSQLEDLGLLAGDDGSPVLVVGSGKTAMDTVLALRIGSPNRRISLVAGSGTFFSEREKLFPTGRRRWYTGISVNSALAQVARRFDGHNASAASDYFLHTFGLSALEAPIHNFFGILSRPECTAVREGLNRVVRDHLEDVVDADRGPIAVLRSGASIALERDTWLVNCTGHFKPREIEHEPYSSPSGAITSINSSSVTLGFSSFSGYFQAELLFRDLLAAVPLYAVDFDALKRLAPRAVPVILATLVQYNLSLLLEHLPLSAFRSCGLDFERWYPAPRRLAAQAAFALRHRAHRDRYRRALDTFAASSGVRCAPAM
jgi:hypothetical protein